MPSIHLHPHPRSSPHLWHHTLTHNFRAYEQTEKNSHQPEPALEEQAPGSGPVTDTRVPKTSLDPIPPRDLVTLQLSLFAPYSFPTYIPDVLKLNSVLLFVQVPLEPLAFLMFSSPALLPL